MTAGTRWLGVAAGMLVAGAAAQAADVSADVAALSAYVWRGQVLNDEPVVQPALNVESGDFAFNVWGNYNTTDKNADDDFTEVDLTLSYGRTLGAVTVGAGVIDYLFPNTDYDSTREIYLSLGLEDVFLAPSLSVYRDVQEVNGTYASFALSKDFEILDKTTLTLGGSIGAADSDYNEFYFGVDDSALNEVSACASVAYAFSEKISLTPCVLYTWLLDSDIRDGARDLYGDAEQVVASVALSVTL